MADRVSASIVIGGTLSVAAYVELAALIADEGLSIEWDGERFAPEHRTVGQPLSLYAHEVAWGIFQALETWCAENRVSFARWCGGYGSEWGPQRTISRADGRQATFAVTEDDEVVIGLADIEKLGSMAAIRAYFAEADFVVPPLIVAGDAPEEAVPAADGVRAEGPSHVE
jgi:hypothetical protein